MKARVCCGFQAASPKWRTLLPEQLAEGEELGSNVLLSWCDRKLHMGVRLGSKSCIENPSKFGSEKFGISLAHQVRVSESRSVRPAILDQLIRILGCTSALIRSASHNSAAR